MAMPLTPSPTIVSKVVIGQIGVELDVLRHEGGAGLFGGLLGAGDFGDEPWMVAHLVDVADLDVVGAGSAGPGKAGGETPPMPSMS